ncbi:TIGR03943 family putative permease subunit [Microbacterium album]|uniref:TIGR03943 family protein n=1 Tax=Microbacterium album TaxID=2053191 RepID=A0A917IG11_9MICO|nr:TIGR03943 family protein [Microbacterium album]GGH42737.1 TIGR03943 family protein [Microbacterium album]
MRELLGARGLRSIGTRWLGAGLAAAVSVVTLSLAITGRLSLYINPDQAWFAVGMAVVALVGTVLSFLLPLGGEDDHGHDHGHEPHEGAVPAPASHPPHDDDHDHREDTAAQRIRQAHAPRTHVAVAVGGVLASGIVVASLVLPPAPLSVELAMARDTGTAPLFAGADTVRLAASSDPSDFGVGQWSAVFATATSPDTFEGTRVTLSGFVTPQDGDGDVLRLGRLVITHCVIDAQPASVPVVSPGWEGAVDVGDWVEVDGVVTTDASGGLVIQPREIAAIPEPDDPYEY